MDTKKTQKLSIRLIKSGLDPESSIRAGKLENFSLINAAKIMFGTNDGGSAPKWASFLELSANQRDNLANISAYAVLFINANSRWFVVSFGGGFQKIEPTAVEQDFGLRVVVNVVDHKKLRSADLRTPNDNTTSTRTQASRQSSQEVFEIDHERDLVRGLEGTPTNPLFASRAVGSDALTLWRQADVSDLPKICTEAFDAYNKTNYQTHFPWIDFIKHERDVSIIGALEKLLLEGLNTALTGTRPESLHLAWPVLYDPHNSSSVHYSGFRSASIFTDLDIRNYIDELKTRDIKNLEESALTKHFIEQTDDDGNRTGEKYPLCECCVFDVDHNGQHYVLSSGRWYKVAKQLAAEVAEFFSNTPRLPMPPARDGETEPEYNQRLTTERTDWICFDTHEIKPTGATSEIEPCDFWDPQGYFIHIKNETSSSKLSHLFNQGAVSARVFKTDIGFRSLLKEKARQLAGDKLADTLPSGSSIDPSKLTVLFAVMREPISGGEPKLPFFSLVTLRQAAKEVEALGYKYAFAWIFKGTPPVSQPKKRKKGTASSTSGPAVPAASGASGTSGT